jgi:hypothetical protein
MRPVLSISKSSPFLSPKVTCITNLAEPYVEPIWRSVLEMGFVYDIYPN